MANYVATAETEINASPAQVWAALTDPELIKQYMFGSQVETDWHPRSPIVEGRVRGQGIPGQGRNHRDRPESAAESHSLQPAERTAGRSRQLPYAALRTRGAREQDARLPEPGQQPERGRGRTRPGQLENDARQHEKRCRARLILTAMLRTALRLVQYRLPGTGELVPQPSRARG
jgi:hypothetical protein